MNRSRTGTSLSGGSLSAADFGARFEAASRALWCIAVGVTGDRSRAEDLVQEAAAVALTKMHEFDPSTSFLAWMGQIVRYLALNERRRMIRERAVLSGTPADEASDRRADTRRTGRRPVDSSGRMNPEQSSFDDELIRAVSTLDETQRSCLLLRIVMDLSYKEISRALAIPEGTAMSHVHRARHALRARLTAPGGAPPASPEAGER